MEASPTFSQCILTIDEEEEYTAEGFARFREADLVDLAVQLARQEDFASLEVPIFI
jgi:hypothetical protein